MRYATTQYQIYWVKGFTGSCIACLPATLFLLWQYLEKYTSVFGRTNLLKV